MNVLQTEFEFELPKGFVDQEGTLHKKGSMRLANAADEILPMRDPRVQGNAAYLSVIVLARVVVRLGTLAAVNTQMIESLFVEDFQYLLDMYNRINQNRQNSITVSCPKCEHTFEQEISHMGG